MTELLVRKCHDARRTEGRRIAVAAVVALVCGAVWHGLRPALVKWAARNSVGCAVRSSLIGAALGEEVPEYWWLDAPWGLQWPLATYSLPRPGVVVLRTNLGLIPGLGGPQPVARCRYAYFDHNLEPKGSLLITTHVELRHAVGDMDGDGRWEVLVEWFPAEVVRDPHRRGYGWAVVRLGTSTNEIVGVGLVDRTGWDKRKMRIAPVWRDLRAAAPRELALITVKVVSAPGGGLAFAPSEAVAVFEFESAGGILRPRVLPDDGSVTWWRPPDGRPVPIKPDADLAEFLEATLSVPDDFGAPK